MSIVSEIKPMLEQKWHTIPALQAKISKYVMSTTMSARIRDLRKTAHGSHTVKRRPKKGFKGLWEYKIEL